VDGISDESAVFPTTDATLSVAWKRPLGSGYSGVSVADGRAIAMFSDGTSDVTAAFDAQTGKELWRFEIGPTYQGHDGSFTGPIATPALDAERVYGLSAFGRLFALDVRSGQLVWSTDLAADHAAPKPFYGFGTSPVLWNGVLVVQLGAKDAMAAGFNPATGERLWSAGNDDVAYQSPVPMELFGRQTVLATGNTKLAWVDADKGEVLYEQAHEGGGMGRGAYSMVPVPVGDSRLFMAYKDDSSTLIQLAGSFGSTESERVWEDRSIRNSYNVPVYYENHLYAFSSRVLTCVNAADGKSQWRSRRPGDGFLILVDGHLVIATKEGGVHVVEATSSGYREVARVQLFDDLCWTPPSFADAAIYVRSLGEIARIDIRQGTSPAQLAASASSLPGQSPFDRFLAEASRSADKTAVVDRFLATITEFPLIEQDGRVHFIYRGPGSDVAIGGDLWGARQEASMTHIEGTDLFYYSTRLEPDARINYVFIRDYEEITDPRNPRKTVSELFGRDMELPLRGETLDMSWLAMPLWKAAPYLQDRPTAFGRVETHELKSERLKKKHTLDVYLPHGYDTGDRRYPVLYVHGGKTAREHGKLVEALDLLIGRSIQPVIAVFIRHEPFFVNETYTGLFAEEIVPFIDATYRTLASADQRASIGAGFAGYSALLCAFSQPKRIGKTGAQSAFMLDSMVKPLKEAIKLTDPHSMQIYLDWGTYDLRNRHEAWDMGEINRTLARHLEDRGFTIHGGEIHEGTGWSSWRNRTDQLLSTMFPR
jgi:enterochelin esterase-like enzyme/outer membrane protein assembly factor BamB